MTAAPIMWFATCDYEYEKDEYHLRKKQEMKGSDDQISSKGNKTQIAESEVSRD